MRASARLQNIEDFETGAILEKTPICRLNKEIETGASIVDEPRHVL